MFFLDWTASCQWNQIAKTIQMMSEEETLLDLSEVFRKLMKQVNALMQRYITCTDVIEKAVKGA